MIVTIVCRIKSCANTIGKRDRITIAEEDGLSLDDEKLEEEEEFDIKNATEKEVAAKYVRVLDHEEENIFALIFECGKAA